MEKVVAVAGRLPFYLCFLGRAYCKAGRTKDAEQIVAEMEQLGRKQYVQPVSMA